MDQLSTELSTGFVGILENLESPGKRPLVLESSGNLLNSTKNMKCMEDSKENINSEILGV